MKIKIGGKEVEVADELVTKAIEEKTTIDISGDYVIRTNEEEETFKTNIKTEHEKVGRELGLKEFKKHAGIEIEGKDPKAIADAFKLKIEAESKIEPDKKVAQLMQDIETLKGTIEQKKNEVETVSKTFTEFKNETRLTSSLMSLIPSNSILPKEDVAILLRNKIKTGFDENGNIVVLDENGNIQKDPSTLTPIPLKNAVDLYYSQNPEYLSGASGGAGGKDTPPGGTKKTTAQFVEEMRAKGINQGTPEFMNELDKQSKEGLIE